MHWSPFFSFFSQLHPPLLLLHPSPREIWIISQIIRPYTVHTSKHFTQKCSHSLLSDKSSAHCTVGCRDVLCIVEVRKEVIRQIIYIHFSSRVKECIKCPRVSVLASEMKLSENVKHLQWERKVLKGASGEIFYWPNKSSASSARDFWSWKCPHIYED